MSTSTHPILGPGGAAFLAMRCTNVNADTRRTGSLTDGAGEEVARCSIIFRGGASPAFRDLLDTAAGEADGVPFNLGDRIVQFDPDDADGLRFAAKVKLRVVNADGSAFVVVSAQLPGSDDDPAGARLMDLHMQQGVVILRPADAAQGDMFDGPAHLVPVLTIHAPGVPMVETQATGSELTDEIGRVQFDMAEVKAGKKVATTEAIVDAAPKPKRRRAKGVTPAADWGAGKDAAANQGEDATGDDGDDE